MARAGVGRAGIIGVTLIVMTLTLAVPVGASAPARSSGTSRAVWSPTEIATPPNGVSFEQQGFGIACPAVGSCVAVWSYYDANQDGFGVIETLSGGAWTESEAPLPGDAAANPEVALDTPVCPAVGSCLVTGSYDDANGSGQGLIETQSGGTWTASTAPLPGDAGVSHVAYLVAANCAAVDACVAVGDYTDTTGNVEPLVETLSAGVWTASQSPLPADAATSGQRTYMSRVACPDTTDCVAIGVYTDAAANQHVVSEVLLNGSWTPTEISLPFGAPKTNRQIIMFGLACPAVNSCVAVGEYLVGPPVDNSNSIIDTLAGGVWTTRNAPVPNLPPVEFGDQLSAVACTGVGACVAVGSYNARNLQGEPGLIDTLSKGTWTATSAPGAPHATAGLNNVVCPAAGSCVATGFFVILKAVKGGFTEQFEGLIETEVGGRWIRTLAPLPSDAAFDPQMFSLPVACPAVGSCVGSGTYWNGNMVPTGWSRACRVAWPAP